MAEREIHDLIIIGGGSAGLGAALYAARYKLKTLVLSETIGGLGLEIHDIRNYLGFEKISGSELMKRFSEHVKNLDVKLIEDPATRIEKEKDVFRIVTGSKKNFFAKSLIIATGTKRRHLNVPGEEKFLGKGVSYCATCDGPLFKDKVVAIVGGSDAAAVSALLLAEYAKKVYIIYRREKIRAEPINAERVAKNPKIEIVTKANVTEIKGNKFVTSAMLDTGQEVKLDGLFIEIGGIPITALVKEISVALDEKNQIVVDREQKTNIAGVFAAGDVANNPLKQVITAVADGAIAATSAYNFIKKTG